MGSFSGPAVPVYGLYTSGTSHRRVSRPRLRPAQHTRMPDRQGPPCTTFVHRGVCSAVLVRVWLWTCVCTAVPAKFPARTSCGAFRARTRTSPTATPEGHQGAGQPEPGGQKRRQADRRTVDHLAGATRRAADGAAGVRTDRKAGRHRSTARATGRAVGRSAEAGLTGPGNRTPSSTATRGPSDAYSEGPLLCLQPRRRPLTSGGATRGHGVNSPGPPVDLQVRRGCVDVAS